MSAPRERGWRWFVVAVAVVLFVTLAPLWPPALALAAAVVRLVLPFEQFALLALVSLAGCTVVGWWAGGRLLLSLLALVLAGWVLWHVPLPVSNYGAFVRGWAIALGAAFGLVCLSSGKSPFLGRALASVALTAVVSGAGLASGKAGSGVFVSTARMLDEDYQRRLDESLALWKSRTESGVWQTFAAKLPGVAARAELLAGRLESLDRESETRAGSLLVLLAPSLLALESMLALALGWASYHRLSRTRIGPPLGSIRQLRFNDQLVWGLVVGAVLGLLPSLSQFRVAGLNLLCFFGALYALRGAGVLSYWISDRVAVPLLLGLVILVPLLGPAPVLITVVVVCFGIGLSDTWRDFRAGVKAR